MTFYKLLIQQTHLVLVQGESFIPFDTCSELQTAVEMNVPEGSFPEEIAPIRLNHFPLRFIRFLSLSSTTSVTQFLPL